MEELKALGYNITYSGPLAMVGYKYCIHAHKTVDGVLQGIVAGYGDDEAASVADALNTLRSFK